MFPLNSNMSYIKDNGERDKLGNVIGSGGGGGGGSTIYHDSTPPDNSLGEEGDIYLYMPSNIAQEFTINITKALRGTSEQSYCGAQEIQLFLTDGSTSKNITEFSGFYCSANGGSINYAFDGNTGGTYWEKSGLPAIITFGAIVPVGWDIEKLVVWQRNSPEYPDVWKDFELKYKGMPILTETDLTQADWDGAGTGTTFDDFTNTSLNIIATTFYKVKIGDVVQWIS